MCLIWFLIITSTLLSLGAIFSRRFLYKTQKEAQRPSFWWLMYVSLLGNILGAVAFYQLSTLPVVEGFDYSKILTVLSLLAAAVIAGFLAWSFMDAAKDEIMITTFISICFTSLFYALFFALSFYIGKSKYTHYAEFAPLICSLIMWIIMMVNTLIDFWDYRAVSEAVNQKSF